jgi:hypothetical protein
MPATTPRTNLGSKIVELRRSGLSVRQIAKQAKCCVATVSYYTHHMPDPKLGPARTIHNYTQREKVARARILKQATTRVTAQGRENKLILVGEKGGKCQNCGYNKCLAALTFHHRDPMEKTFAIAGTRLRSYSIETLRREAAKCDLLCANCHMEEHDRGRE